MMRLAGYVAYASAGLVIRLRRDEPRFGMWESPVVRLAARDRGDGTFDVFKNAYGPAGRMAADEFWSHLPKIAVGEVLIWQVAE